MRSLNHAAIAQGNATNQWSYFQAVSIKLHMYQFEKRRNKADDAAAKAAGAAKAELTLPNVQGAGTVPGGASPAGGSAAVVGTPEKAEKKEKKAKKEGKDGAAAKTDKGGKPKKKKSIAEQIEKYAAQKPQIEARARAFEADVEVHRKDSERAQRHTKELTLALAVLQVAIAVGSIAALAKKKPLWFVSMIIGVYGVFATFDGIFLWFT